MIGNYDDLKTALTDSGNPFVWVTSEGWAFHDQPDAFKFSAETAIGCNSFDELMDTKQEPADAEQPIQEPADAEQPIQEPADAEQPIQEPAPKGRNKKK